MRSACIAGGESWERPASWPGETTKRSAEYISAYRNRDSQFLVRIMTIICCLLDQLQPDARLVKNPLGRLTWYRKPASISTIRLLRELARRDDASREKMHLTGASK